MIGTTWTPEGVTTRSFNREPIADEDRLMIIPNPDPLTMKNPNNYLTIDAKYDVPLGFQKLKVNGIIKQLP